MIQLHSLGIDEKEFLFTTLHLTVSNSLINLKNDNIGSVIFH